MRSQYNGSPCIIEPRRIFAIFAPSASLRNVKRQLKRIDGLSAFFPTVNAPGHLVIQLAMRPGFVPCSLAPPLQTLSPNPPCRPENDRGRRARRDTREPRSLIHTLCRAPDAVITRCRRAGGSHSQYYVWGNGSYYAPRYNDPSSQISGGIRAWENALTRYRT
jgi:hypothetical protein